MALQGEPPQSGSPGGRGWATSRRKPRNKNEELPPPRPPRLGQVWRGPLKGPRGPFKGSRGPFKGPRGPFRGPRGPFKGPQGA